ncbi:MAG: hypothetical protein MI702_02690 [Chlorobiales bacterium]|nr:hypothetical protein [Chlorobiales bacterium]
MHSEAYQRQVGDPRSSFSKKIDQFHIHLLINDTYERISDCDSLFCNSSGRRGPPYTLLIGTSFYGETRDVTAIHEVMLQIGAESPIALHSADDEPIRLAFEPWLDHAVKANHRIPLVETLPFLENEELVITVRFQPPESAETHAITTIFRSKKESVSRSKLMMLLQGS